MTEHTHTIFGIPVDSLPRAAVEDLVRDTLAGNAFRRIATVNPEFLVQAHRNEAFRQNLLSADFRITDGVGIVFDAFLSGRRLFRYPGADLFRFVLSEAEREEKSVFLMVRNDGLSSLTDAVNAIRTTYPNLAIDGAECDPISDTVPDAACEAMVVLCNFGAPEQEYALESLRENPGNVRLSMGIGGSLDFLTGRVRRAPVFMRRLGLEWLFRLIGQPRRLERIMTAIVIFPFLRLSDRIGPANRNQRNRK